MANSSKEKGDRYEREAVPVFAHLLPEFVVKKPRRMLGAGRQDDVGDLAVLPDVAIQVRALVNMGKAVRTSSADAVSQAANGDMPYSLGVVPVQGARKDQVRWLACVDVDSWPTPVEPVAEFSIVSKALAWVRDDKGPYGYQVWDRAARIGLLSGQGSPALVAPLEAWVEAYRHAKQSSGALAA
ncbi:hypothetical protein [Arthrobacter sp. A2-55]|uniref:hypothetical protein n=1 Tax=Arthrobacter sp. A2-55 TaxID=2897337 RepID=UPI0021CD7275|nr:hypothetical protein [Arthrobacter sp. A2-55]MCU6479080.1 hypothetical protein [Arthrobacter sp. A2-55]